jgi:hypothetical protein
MILFFLLIIKFFSYYMYLFINFLQSIKVYSYSFNGSNCALRYVGWKFIYYFLYYAGLLFRPAGVKEITNCFPDWSRKRCKHEMNEMNDFAKNSE